MPSVSPLMVGGVTSDAHPGVESSEHPARKGGTMPAYIGYVSTPFGTKGGVDFDALFTQAIYLSPAVATGSSDVMLFREDSQRPPWQSHHLARIEQFRGGYQTFEWQLRQSIQDNIIGSDFIIAVLTGFNPNVMLEVGFAQAQRKIIVYVLQADQFQDMPANLANLKRLQLYKSMENLKVNLYNRIQEVIDDLGRQSNEIRRRGGPFFEYYVNRDAIGLVQKFSNAQKRIQILSTNLTTVSVNYIDAIVSAVTKSPDLTVKILTSDPANEFIAPRADQLREDKKGYQMELQGSLESVRAKLKRYKNCELRTYKDFPVQMWHLIDDRIYIGAPSLARRTRHNCVFGISVEGEGVKKTFLDHFDALWEKAGIDRKCDSGSRTRKESSQDKHGLRSAGRKSATTGVAGHHGNPRHRVNP